ncbi:MAG: hypothetical protein Q4P28_06335 [Tissierellia bacterium]|nr:hypothetical protein [Tissierellia bacterium]
MDNRKITGMIREKKKYIHEVKLLLKLYRKVNFHVSDRYEQIDESLYDTYRKNMEEIISSVLEVDSYMNIEKLEQSLIDINTSILLLNLMDSALERLRRYPDKGAVYAKLLELKYFDKNKYSCERISEKLDISRTTYFRYSKNAIQMYSTMLFGYAIPEVKEVLEKMKDLPLVAEKTSPYQ